MPATFEPEFFDPMSTEHVTNTICEMFERQDSPSFATEVPQFDGSGLYAIYYKGQSEPLYSPLTAYDIPIYVGQGASHNSATGSAQKEPRPVFQRLKDHRQSIDGGGLDVAEFTYRVLLMPDVHANLGENGLRVAYQPLWNSTILNGFGSHEQGSSTRRSSRSRWDTLHPGRQRTFGVDRHNPDELRSQVAEHIARQIAGYGTLPWRI